MRSRLSLAIEIADVSKHEVVMVGKTPLHQRPRTVPPKLAPDQPLADRGATLNWSQGQR